MLKPMMDGQENSSDKGPGADQKALLDILTATPNPSTILEYGSGGSTVLFADLMEERSLVSIEHNPEWFTKVGEELDTHAAKSRVTRVLAPLDFHIGLWKFARPEEEMPAGAQHYIWAPDDSAHIDWSTVSMAFVDGIARGACLAYLVNRLNPGTPVLLHDYKGREAWYDWAVSMYEFVQQHDLTIELRTPK